MVSEGTLQMAAIGYDAGQYNSRETFAQARATAHSATFADLYELLVQPEESKTPDYAKEVDRTVSALFGSVPMTEAAYAARLEMLRKIARYLQDVRGYSEIGSA